MAKKALDLPTAKVSATHSAKLKALVKRAERQSEKFAKAAQDVGAIDDDRLFERKLRAVAQSRSTTEKSKKI